MCEVCFVTSTAPRAEDPWATNGRTMPEVAGALQGKTQSLVRVNREGETIVSVGVPIQHMMATRGALLLSTQGGDIDRVITSARLAQLRFFLVLAIVMLVSVAFARQHNRRACPAARRRGGTRAAWHPVAPANSRFHRAIGRDRPPVSRAARYDAGAL